MLTVDMTSSSPTVMPSSSSPSTSTRTPLRTTLSNLGQVVTGRRRAKRKNKLPSLHEGEPSTSNIVQKKTTKQLSNRTSSTTQATEHESVTQGGPNNSQWSPQTSSQTSFSSHHPYQQTLMSPSHNMRITIRSALINRGTFEPAFQSLTNEILSGTSEIPLLAVDEIFLQLKNTKTSCNSKSLGLELLDSIVILDVRCLVVMAMNNSGLKLLVDLASATVTSNTTNTLPIVPPAGTSSNEVQQLINTAKRVLHHWEVFITESSSRLPAQAGRILEATRTMREQSSSGLRTQLVDPLGGRVPELPVSSSLVPLSISVPLLTAPIQARSPSASTLSRGGHRNRSLNRPIPLPSPLFTAENSRVEEQLASSLSLIELTQETIRQAQGSGAKGMVEDLIHQCNREKKILTEMMSNTADANDYGLFDQIQKVEADLKSALDSAQLWIQENSSNVSVPTTSSTSQQLLSRPLRKFQTQTPPVRTSTSASPTTSYEPLQSKPLDSSVSPVSSKRPKKSKSTLSTVKQRKLDGPGQSDVFDQLQPRPPPTLTDDFADPFSSDPFRTQTATTTGWPPPATPAPPTPLAPVATDDDFFAAASWAVDFPTTPIPETTKSQTAAATIDSFIVPTEKPNVDFFDVQSTLHEGSPAIRGEEPPRRILGEEVKLPNTESEESAERRRRKKKTRKAKEEGKRKENGRRLSQPSDSQDSAEQRPEEVEFIDISQTESSATVDRLKSKIKKLEARLASLEIELRPKIESEVRAQLTIELNHQLSMVQAAHDATRRDVDELKKELKEKEEEIEELRNNIKKKDHEMDHLRYDLEDREKAVTHAKDMWMRESGRAATVSDNLDELEKKLLEKENHLIVLSKKYQDMSRETAALKSLVKADLDDFDSPSKRKSSLFVSVPPEKRSTVASSLVGETLQHHRSHRDPDPINSESLPVQFYSVDQEWSPSTRVPDILSSSKAQRRYQSEDTRGGNSYKPRGTRLANGSPSSLTNSANLHQHHRTKDIFGVSGIDWQDISTGDTSSILLERDQEDILERYRALLFCNDEILYEDSTIQIGVKAHYKGLTGTLHLYFGNHSPSDLQSFGVSLQATDESLGMTYSQLPPVLGARKQLYQSIVVTCSEPYDHSPILRLRYLLPDNSPTLIQLALPLPVTKFVEGKYLDYEDFFRFWKHEEFLLKEVSALIQLDRKRFRRSLLLITRAIQLNGALRLLPGVDPSEDNLVFAGVFPPSQTDIGIPTSLVLVRYESGRGHYRDVGRLSIRSDSLILGRALRSILTTVLALSTRDSLPFGLH